MREPKPIIPRHYTNSAAEVFGKDSKGILQQTQFNDQRAGTASLQALSAIVSGSSQAKRLQAIQYMADHAPRANPDIRHSLPTVAQLGQGQSTASGAGKREPLGRQEGVQRFREAGESSYPHGNYEKRKYLREVNLSAIEISEGMKSNEDLMCKIRDHGFNTFFAVLIFQTGGTLKLVDGHNRFTAMKMLEEKTIPAYVIPEKVHKRQEKKKEWHSLF